MWVKFEKQKENGREMRYRGFDLVQFLGFILLWSFVIVVEASIHEYRNEGFSRRLNSYFHGGSEGLYASKLHLSHLNSEDKPLNGESFIKYSPSISLVSPPRPHPPFFSFSMMIKNCVYRLWFSWMSRILRQYSSSIRGSPNTFHWFFGKGVSNWSNIRVIYE